MEDYDNYRDYDYTGESFESSKWYDSGSNDDEKACTVTAIGIQMIPGTVMTPTGIPTGDIKRLIICN